MLLAELDFLLEANHLLLDLSAVVSLELLDLSDLLSEFLFFGPEFLRFEFEALELGRELVHLSGNLGGVDLPDSPSLQDFLVPLTELLPQGVYLG